MCASTVEITRSGGAARTKRAIYLYTAEELGPWADRIVDLAANPDVKEVLVFFNNHRQGQAVRNAEMFEGVIETRFLRATIRRPTSASKARTVVPQLDFGN
ncbi:MAG: hypothetical protein NVS2B17_26380 [Candidatus Velthaea sp.]